MEEEKPLLQAMIPPLLDWFQDHARSLPWREDPQPYHVWISEIMLQQTRVAAVLGYYARFLDRLPTVEALAKVPEQELLKLWEGLGYYNRARNLQKAARKICDELEGVFPSSYDRLLELPGIGEYTAGAIASIAYGQPVPAVDGNVLRVITRLTADRSDIGRPETKKAIRSALEQIIPAAFPGRFNQALMELGALVCLPNGAPLCRQCPLRALCRARREELIDQIPVKEKKKARRIQERKVCLIFHKGRIALRRRPEEGLLAGLWEYPNFAPGEPGPEQWGLNCTAGRDGGAGKHIFTHIEWHMTALCMAADSDRLPEGWVWADETALRERYPIPNAFACFREQAEAGLRGQIDFT